MGKVALDQAAVAQSLENRSRSSPGVTCVAFFGKQRPWVFNALVDWFQDFLRSRLSEWLKNDWIRLAPIEQVHATLIGMEASIDHQGLVSKYVKESNRVGQIRPME